MPVDRFQPIRHTGQVEREVDAGSVEGVIQHAEADQFGNDVVHNRIDNRATFTRSQQLGKRYEILVVECGDQSIDHVFGRLATAGRGNGL